ncbi:hypothetical protein M747DRAFT_170560 [Aspergillus niger ATCC 13496]|uniref:Uncharacterized protein n=1 Tax=Aspergillus niger ATCC 13496 TaxID=1353008 RepID=A0A370C6F5_ASPNG|nr:hypothetical protein M747DRAFT_170560 [Aspergillus niger ATCC 13496]
MYTYLLNVWLFSNFSWIVASKCWLFWLHDEVVTELYWGDGLEGNYYSSLQNHHAYPLTLTFFPNP